MIWDFKKGKRTGALASIVAGSLAKAYSEEERNEMIFVCVPTDNGKGNEIRYKAFCDEVTTLTGMQNGYVAVSVEENRLAVTEKANGKRVNPAKVVNIDGDYFKGKKCIVFDDLLTLGYNYAQFAYALEEKGAEVLGGYFIGKVVRPVENEADAAR